MWKARAESFVRVSAMSSPGTGKLWTHTLFLLPVRVKARHGSKIVYQNRDFSRFCCCLPHERPWVKNTQNCQIVLFTPPVAMETIQNGHQTTFLKSHTVKEKCKEVHYCCNFEPSHPLKQPLNSFVGCSKQ